VQHVLVVLARSQFEPILERRATRSANPWSGPGVPWLVPVGRVAPFEVAGSVGQPLVGHRQTTRAPDLVGFG